MKSTSDLTILLTLKDRALYTCRWMNYANTIAMPFKVLIADGGSDLSVPAMFSDKTRYPNVDFEYLGYPYDKSYSDYYAKLADALRSVRTPFVAMADNDDFYTVDPLNEAVEFLSVNPDYATCGGQGFRFWLQPSAHSTELYGNHIDYKCVYIPSITDDTAKARLMNQSRSSADPNYYDVRRTEDAKRQFNIVHDLGLSDLFLVEILIQFQTAIAGKMKRLDRLHVARQHNSPGSSGVIHAEKYGDWFGRMLVESWSSDFKKVLKCVSEDLATADRISIEEATHCVVSSYRMLVAPSLLSSILDEPSVTLSMPVVAAIVRRLVKLPEGSILRRSARSLYRKLRWISLDAVSGGQVVTTGVPSSRSDFQPIVDFLTHFRP